MSDPLFARFGREYNVGDVLFREGDSGHEMFVIQSGAVQITKQVGGVERTLATLGRGDFLGEMAILNQKPRTATATATEALRCLAIDAKTLEAMLAKNPEIAVRLIKKLAARLDSADELVQILMHPDPRARVMLALRRNAAAAYETGRLEISAEALAAEVGVKRDEVWEVLTRLRRLKIVAFEYEGVSIVVSDVGRLLEFLEFLDAPRKTEAS